MEEEIRRTLRSTLPRVSVQLEGLTRPSIRIHAQAADEESLRVGASNNCGRTWGDGGRVHYLIESEAPQSRDFNKVCTIVQCY